MDLFRLIITDPQHPERCLPLGDVRTDATVGDLANMMGTIAYVNHRGGLCAEFHMMRANVMYRRLDIRQEHHDFADITLWLPVLKLPAEPRNYDNYVPDFAMYRAKFAEYARTVLHETLRQYRRGTSDTDELFLDGLFQWCPGAVNLNDLFEYPDYLAYDSRDGLYHIERYELEAS